MHSSTWAWLLRKTQLPVGPFGITADVTGYRCRDCNRTTLKARYLLRILAGGGRSSPATDRPPTPERQPPGRTGRMPTHRPHPRSTVLGSGARSATFVPAHRWRTLRLTTCIAAARAAA